MIGYIASGILAAVIVVLLIVNHHDTKQHNSDMEAAFLLIDKLGKGMDQLKDIIKRCGAELVVDKDGNFDALIPMTPEEFDEVKRQIKERGK